MKLLDVNEYVLLTCEKQFKQNPQGPQARGESKPEWPGTPFG